jgi:hypothetical protein
MLQCYVGRFVTLTAKTLGLHRDCPQDEVSVGSAPELKRALPLYRNRTPCSTRHLCHWLGFDAAISFAVLNFGNERRPERFRTRLIDDYVRYLSDREGETLFTELA